MDNSEIQKLKATLEYLKSKQRELKRQHETDDTRSIESIIKYLKRDMMKYYNLENYYQYTKDDIRNTDVFIRTLQDILKKKL